MKQKQLTYLVVLLSRTAVFYRYFLGICAVLLVRSMYMLWKKRARSCASTSAPSWPSAMCVN